MVLFLAMTALVGQTQAGPAYESSFLPGTEDIPLHPSMTLVEDESELIFDVLGGRVIHLFAHSKAAPKTLGDFYKTTLPQLGWAHQGGLDFKRDQEQLHMTFTPLTNGATQISFKVEPVS